jgi:hypothetical protein
MGCPMPDENEFDVVICGGGLAGLTLARQLKLELPEISVAVIDRLARPLPEAAFKVGESSIELSTYYFGQVLKLADYFKRCHLFKLGLRFFFGEAHGPVLICFHLCRPTKLIAAVWRMICGKWRLRWGLFCMKALSSKISF